jgi:hypothetical protein
MRSYTPETVNVAVRRLAHESTDFGGELEQISPEKLVEKPTKTDVRGTIANRHPCGLTQIYFHARDWLLPIALSPLPPFWTKRLLV